LSKDEFRLLEPHLIQGHDIYPAVHLSGLDAGISVALVFAALAMHLCLYCCINLACAQYMAWFLHVWGLWLGFCLFGVYLAAAATGDAVPALRVF
jgi:hypothetical protein